MDFLSPLMEQLNDMLTAFIKLLPMIGIAVFILIVTWVVATVAKKIVTRILSHSHIRPSLKSLVTTLLKIGIWILGTLIAMTVVFPSLTPAKLLAGLGIGSIAIGFAFQDIFENFLAGIMIMLRKPMRIGDFIKCDDVEGRIEEINIRDTFVRQTDDQLILVPNSKLFKNEVFVRTDKPLRRFEVVCGVAYDEDLEQSKAVIKKAVESVDLVNKDKAVQVFACAFNSSSVDFNIRWWANSKPLDMHESQDAVIIAVKKALDDAGIEIPFPYRTLTFKESLSLKKEGDHTKNDYKPEE